MKFTLKRELGTRVEFLSGSRKGCQAVVEKVCSRHQYYVVEIIKGNREYRKGDHLQCTYSQEEVKVLP